MRQFTYDLTGKAGLDWYYVSSCLHFPAIVTPYMSFTSRRSTSRGLSSVQHDRSTRSKLFLRINAHAIQRNYFLLSAGRGKICLFIEEKRIYAAPLSKNLNIRFEENNAFSRKKANKRELLDSVKIQSLSGY